ncbi:MAG: phosphopyruvate hydratase [Candidatus Nanohalarchaeota archaeon]|nr:MAG: phosphopyruvate hydratase [Candidatus Nanohaloarchaeota archaeon]
MTSEFGITKIKAREILDSRGNPTVEVDLKAGNIIKRALIPSGASTGSYEAVELRDGEKRYMGKGVLKAVNNVNNIIAKEIIGMDCRNQEELDNKMIELDGTKNKSVLGANAILGVSIAAVKVSARLMNIPLHERLAQLSGNKNEFIMPVPQMNVMNGGKHAGIENDTQEHMLMPIGAKNFTEAVRMCAETYHTLKGLLKQKFGAGGTNIADEGGFAPPIHSVEERLELMLKAVEQAGYAGQIKFALDPAASEFYKDGIYNIREKQMTSLEMVDFYKELIDKYGIISIEDGFAENDFEGFAAMTKEVGNRVQIVGDDLLVTNVERIEKALQTGACNSLLLKVNQVGTLTESIAAANLAFKNNWTVVVSHRSGETEDPFIADLVIGIGANQTKFGAPARSDRCAKYNELIRIEDSLGSAAKYSKLSFGN